MTEENEKKEFDPNNFTVTIVGDEEDFGTEYILDPSWVYEKLEDDIHQLGRLFKWPVEDAAGELLQFVYCHQLSSITEDTLGGVVWDPAVILGKYLERNPNVVTGKRVLDLGSGTGITGFVAAALGAGEVFVTEYDHPILIDLLERNVALNSYAKGGPVFARRLTWGSA